MGNQAMTRVYVAILPLKVVSKKVIEGVVIASNKDQIAIS